jgi:hypothetical protein
MAGNDHPEDSKAGRVRRLYDRLASILKGLPADRREAFQEHLRKQDEHGEETNQADDDHGPAQSGDR